MGWTPSGSGATDGDAIHDNVAAEISAIAEKGAPVGADLLVIEDSAAANVKKRLQISNLPAGGAPTWAAFSPTWAATGVAPALGNATVVTRWVQHGDTVHANYFYTFGNTTTFGTGNYSWTLPTNAALGANFVIGIVRANDAGSATYLGIASLVDSTKFECHETSTVTPNKFTPTVPHTWNDPDLLQIAICYEAA